MQLFTTAKRLLCFVFNRSSPEELEKKLHIMEDEKQREKEEKLKSLKEERDKQKQQLAQRKAKVILA